ncbi:MAG: cupin domain-containing protein [candidate division KSB1 bacterium]|nr:cupin domain-containing protein [candidate division KSB1 bacterium]
MKLKMHETFLNEAEIFLLGALDEAEQKEFLQHITAGCAACEKAIADMVRVVRALPFALLPSSDSSKMMDETLSNLKHRLLTSIKNIHQQSSPETDSVSDIVTGPQIWKAWAKASHSVAAETPGISVCRANEGAWEDIGINGISVKHLFIDPAHDSVTMLVRMPAGASYPRHRHGGAEQCYVLEGDLHDGDVTLHAGDYQCADANSLHGVQYTENGCLLLIVSSLHDELI